MHMQATRTNTYELNVRMNSMIYGAPLGVYWPRCCVLVLLLLNRIIIYVYDSTVGH